MTFEDANLFENFAIEKNKCFREVDRLATSLTPKVARATAKQLTKHVSPPPYQATTPIRSGGGVFVIASRMRNVKEGGAGGRG